MELGRFGKVLSEYYNIVKSRVADFIMPRPILRASFLHFFVRPGVWLARKKLSSGGKLWGGVAFTLVLFGTAWVTLLYFVASVFKKEA